MKNKNRKSDKIIPFILVLLFFVLSAFSFFQGTQLPKHGEAEGTLQQTEKVLIRENGKSRIGFNNTYEYEVDGKFYETEKLSDIDNAEDTITINYDLENPEKEVTKNKTFTVLGVIFSSLGIVFGAIFSYLGIRRSKK